MWSVGITPSQIFSKKKKKMANDNHLFSVTLYNVTMINSKYYNEFFELGQQKINFKFFELSLPDDDPVYTLKKVMEQLSISITVLLEIFLCLVSFHLRFFSITSWTLSMPSMINICTFPRSYFWPYSFSFRSSLYLVKIAEGEGISFVYEKR